MERKNRAEVSEKRAQTAPRCSIMSWQFVTPQTSLRIFSVTLPMPLTFLMGSVERKARIAAVSAGSSYCPLGLFRSEQTCQVVNYERSQQAGHFERRETKAWRRWAMQLHSSPRLLPLWHRAASIGLEQVPLQAFGCTQFQHCRSAL